MFPNLNAEMARHGLKAKELAAALSISERTVSNKLNGKTEFTLSEIKKITALFPNISIDYLFISDCQS